MGTFCYFAKAPEVFDKITYQQKTLFVFNCCSQRVIYYFIEAIPLCVNTISLYIYVIYNN